MNFNHHRLIGDKPIYWTQGSANGEASIEDIISFLGKGTPRRGRSLAKGVKSLPVFHNLSLNKEGFPKVSRMSFFGHLTAAPDMEMNPNPSDVSKTIRNSVLRIASKYKKIGLLLSGGFDSTLLAYLFKEAGIELQAYTIETKGTSGPKEWGYASRVATLLDIPCNRVMINCHCIDTIEYKNFLIHHSTPILCWITAIQMQIAKQAMNDNCDCLISGIGSDEVFGGYHKTSKYAWRFRLLANSLGKDLAWMKLLDQNSLSNRKFLSIGQCCPFPRAKLIKLFPEINVNSCLDNDVLALYREIWNSNQNVDITAALLSLEIELRNSDIILSELRAVTQNLKLPLEYPFLDSEVLALGARIPISWKYVYGDCPELNVRPKTKAVDKYILRLAFQDIMPGFVQNRPRNTFTLPYGGWLKANLKKELNYIRSSSIWNYCGARRSELSTLFVGNLDGNPWLLPFRLWVASKLCLWWESGGIERLNMSALRL